MFVDYHALCRSPERHLARLGEAIGLNDPAALAAQATAFRPPRPSPPLPDLPDAIARRATELYAELCRNAVNQGTCR